MKVILTPTAQRELEAIGDYIALDNPRQADRFLGELLGTCQRLSEFPKRFPLVDRYETHAIRRCLHGNYLIFYRIEPELVRILHILHGASDYGELISGEQTDL